MFSVWNNALIFLVPVSSFLVTLSCVPLVKRLATRWGCTALPRKERWHTRPTPTIGGLAIFLGFVPPVLWLSPNLLSLLPFFIIVTQMFVVGIYDDVRRIN